MSREPHNAIKAQNISHLELVPALSDFPMGQQCSPQCSWITTKLLVLPTSLLALKIAMKFYNTFNTLADQLSFSGNMWMALKYASHSHKKFPQNTLKTQTTYFIFRSYLYWIASTTLKGSAIPDSDTYFLRSFHNNYWLKFYLRRNLSGGTERVWHFLLKIFLVVFLNNK